MGSGAVAEPQTCARGYGAGRFRPTLDVAAVGRAVARATVDGWRGCGAVVATADNRAGRKASSLSPRASMPPKQTNPRQTKPVCGTTNAGSPCQQV